MRHLKKISRFIVAFFYVALLAFLVYYIQKLDFSVLQTVQIAWLFALIAGIFSLAMRYWQVVSWLIILKDLGATWLRKDYLQLAYIYAKSWLGRYIPGTAPWILGKIYFASKHGVSKNKLAVSSLLEAILQVTTILGLSILLIIIDPRFDVVSGQIRMILPFILAACIVVVIPPIFNRIISLLYRIVKHKTFPDEHKMSTSTLLKGIALYTVGGILNGLAIFFLTKSIYPALGYNEALFVMGATNLAGALGILAIFTPSGLGVRDGVLLLLLGLIMPAEYALAVTILARIWDVALDLLFFAVSWTAKKISE